MSDDAADDPECLRDLNRVLVGMLVGLPVGQDETVRSSRPLLGLARAPAGVAFTFQEHDHRPPRVGHNGEQPPGRTGQP